LSPNENKYEINANSKTIIKRQCHLVIISKATVTTTIQLRFACDSTAVRLPSTTIRPCYDHSTTCVTTVGLPWAAAWKPK